MSCLVTYQLAFQNNFYGTGFRSFNTLEEARSFIQELAETNDVSTITWQFWFADLVDQGTSGPKPG